MKLSRIAVCVALVALPVSLAGAAAQEKPQAAPQAMPPAPKPGPEHAVLKDDEGVWDATVEFFMAPGAPPMVSNGVETNTIGCGGLCLITDFKGEAMGQPFHGHGTAGFDPMKKKYVSTWIDSMSPSIALGESTYDPAKKALTGWVEGADMTGTVVKSKAVTEWPAAGTRIFSMYMTGPDGKEVLGMRITYKRR